MTLIVMITLYWYLIYKKGECFMSKKRFDAVVDLCCELKEVIYRLERLDNFVKSDQFIELSEIHQGLLTDQLDIMYDYARVLGRRIEDLT